MHDVLHGIDNYVNAGLLLAILSAVAELPKILSHLGVIPLLSDLSSRKRKAAGIKQYSRWSVGQLAQCCQCH